jgi:hypothetical protein
MDKHQNKGVNQQPLLNNKIIKPKHKISQLQVATTSST